MDDRSGNSPAGIGSARDRPRVRERAVDVRDRRSLDGDSGITPRFHVALGSPTQSRPTQSPETNAEASINRDDLAMVSTEPAEGAVEPWAVEGLASTPARPAPARHGES